MADLDRLPDDRPDQFNDADIEEAISEVKDWNRDISPTEKRYARETVLRENLTITFTIIIVFWLLSVILILVGNTTTYKLSDNVLIALMVTSSANVIGMMIIILKNLFPNRDGK